MFSRAHLSDGLAIDALEDLQPPVDSFLAVTNRSVALIVERAIEHAAE